MANDSDPVDDRDPTEEVGPERSEVSPDACGLPPSDGGQQHEQVGFLEELSEGYEPNEIRVALDGEGLPYFPDEHADLAIAPSFTYENVVCVEDNRSYVEVFLEEISRKSPLGKRLVANQTEMDCSAGSAQRMLDIRSKYNVNGIEETRREFDPQSVKVTFRFGQLVAFTEEDKFTAVRPVRPVCEFYKRQVFSNDDVPDASSPGHKIVFRNCARRFSVGGAAMSLRDQAIYACDWRSPPDPISTRRHLDLFDEKKLNSPEPQKITLFGSKQADD